ncbi:hypothetical protein CF15_01960 [Pyrodictium occultum]|uniref:Thioredoxin-like fold domain-containing protein n=1 Tax=Pyrodictium occultum TaxID=2309 RepID=A0A0V8RUH0_PYROC|nr:hypothetical protein [Pyrodictium occultum]KSW11618.1 hypothetical protein CF15_01960 [Pyrodictium occultum]
MPLDETALRAAIADVLLRTAGLPTLDEVGRIMRRAEKGTRVVIVIDNSRYARAEADNLKKLLERYEGVETRIVEKSSWGSELPPPLISIDGTLEGRIFFYGAPSDILKPIFLLAVAASAEAWRPGRCRGLGGVKGRARLYVVPGLPCAKTLYDALHILCCSTAELEVVNVEGYYATGREIPVRRVPTFISPSGRVHVGEPRDPEELAEWWG